MRSVRARAFERPESLRVKEFDVHRARAAIPAEAEGDGADADRVLAPRPVGEGSGAPVTQRKRGVLGTEAHRQPAAVGADPRGAVVAVGVGAGVAAWAGRGGWGGRAVFCRGGGRVGPLRG